MRRAQLNLRRAVAVLAVVGCAAAVAAGTEATAAPSAPVTGQPVVLPTGQKLGLEWTGGRPRIIHPAGETTPMTVTYQAGHLYAVPWDAMPYLDAGIDRSMFDVTELAAQEGRHGTGRIPVSLTVSGDTTVPGVAITSRSGSRAHGYIADPAAFGAALRDRLGADPTGARRAGTPVPGLTRLALDTPAPTQARPAFVMETLTVKLTPPTGRNLLGALVQVTNTDDSRKYDAFTTFGADDYIKISVPQGHYAVVADATTGNSDGTDIVDYVPIVADYSVTTNNQSVTLDSDRATAAASYTTPSPATLNLVGLDIEPTDGVHDFDSPGISFGYAAENQVLVQPTPRPEYGSLKLDTDEFLTGDGFDYRLTAEWIDGIPASLHRDVRQGDLARVDDRVYGGGDAIAYDRGPVYPDLRGVIVGGPNTKATTHTDYLYGPSEVRWISSVYRSTGSSAENMFSVPVGYPSGGTYGVDWFRPSLGSGFSAAPPFPRPYCVACRTAGTMTLSLASELDSDPAHNGAVGGDATGYERLRVSQDGTGVADVADTDGATFAVPAAAHTYRIEDTLDRAKLGFTTLETDAGQLGDRPEPLPMFLPLGSLVR